MRIRALRPHVVVYDAPDGARWRGGVVWAIVGSVATLRVRAEAWATVDYTGATSDLPDGVVGAPIAVRLTGSYPYAIAEIQGSHFASAGDGDGILKKISRGEFVPAAVPRSITGETDVYWSAEQAD